MCPCALALLLCLPSPARAASPIENIPVSSWVYEAVDYMKLAGLIHAVPSSSRPWTREYAAQFVGEALFEAYFNPPKGTGARYMKRLAGEFAAEIAADRRINAHQYNRWLPLIRFPLDSVDYLNLDFFSRIRGDTANQSASFGGTFNITGTDRFALYSRMEFSGFRNQIPDIRDSAWIIHVPGTREHSLKQQFLLDIPEAYLRYRVPWFELELGRDFLYWGPGYRSSVMLSSTAPSLDQLQLTGTFKRMKFTAFTAALSPWHDFHRYVSGQRLEVNFWNSLVLGGAMLAVYGDSAQTRVPAGYLNPLIPIYFELANTGHDDNLLVGADAALYLPRVKLYAQLLLDNFEFVDPLPRNSELRPPDAYGAQAGFLLGPFGPLTIRTEYARVTSYTYYHRIFQVAYNNYDVPLGHAIGPDADELYADLTLHPFIWGTLGVQGTLTRRGVRNRGDDFNKSWIPKDTTRSLNFPTGTVEQTIAFGPSLTLDPFSSLHLSGFLGWSIVTNAGGVRRQDNSGPSFNFSLEYRY